MTPTAYAIATVAVLVIVALLKHIEDLRAERDRLFIKHSRTCDRLGDEMQAHLRTFRRAIHAEAKVAVTEAALVEAGHEAATHANHLEALLDATSEKPLTLVKGGRR